MTPIEPRLDHLWRLSDDTGLFEHALGAVPRREHGYCVDDAARGLVVLCRERRQALPLIERYLALVVHAQGADGRFRNRLGYDRRWQDEPGTGDWWGRALWGLGTAAAKCTAGWVRDRALLGFETGSRHRPDSLRSMAFAAMGAAEILSVRPEHDTARALLLDASAFIHQAQLDPVWPWPERRLHYANAVLPETLIAAGQLLDDSALLTEGEHLLGWLLRTETRAGYLSLTPSDGWRAGEPRPAFAQQPIEAAAMADACARAMGADPNTRWRAGVELAADWFLGKNDLDVPMYDADTGGGYDGLHADRHNYNQGAESTLALISTLQHARRLEERG
ncbi:MAG: hypothetical protein ABW215_17185 [Kibdelosporangium sp.]